MAQSAYTNIEDESAFLVLVYSRFSFFRTYQIPETAFQMRIQVTSLEM